MKFCPQCSAFHSDESEFCPDDGTELKRMQDPYLGRTIAARYRLVKLLGTGGMSQVYLAHHVVIERFSAIKILRDDLAKNATQRERFLREARAVNRINHPNIVEISDMGEADGVTYQVMEYVDGPSLYQELAKGALPWDRAVRISLQIAAALGRAHQMGVVHRDLKPENILLARRPTEAIGEVFPRQLVHATHDLAKLTDFGIARILDEPTATVGEKLCGTPGYIAPETLGGEAADPRADLYALGVVLYEMTTGSLPYDERGAALLSAPLHGPPIPPHVRRPDYPTLLEHIVLSLLARDPRARPPHAFAVYDALVRLLPSDGASVGASAPHVLTGPQPQPPVGAPRRPREETTLVDAPLPTGAPPHSSKPTQDLTAASAAATARWHEALAEVEASIVVVERQKGEPERIERALELATVARSKVRALERASKVVLAQQDRVDTVQAEGREFRAKIGRALDQLVLDQSRTRAQVEATGEWLASVNPVRPESERGSDALLWETAALEVATGSLEFEEMDISREIRALSVELDDRNAVFEREHAEAAGALEGSLLGVRHLTHELTALLHEARALVGESGERDALSRRPAPPVASVPAPARERTWRR